MTTVKRTVVAQAALDTSALLNMRFASRLVGTRTRRKLMVSVPDGPSTDGGKKVRQSIVLAPADDPGAGTVMCGWLDIAQRRAELRVHDVVRSQYEARYKQPFDVAVDAYDALFRDVKTMLEMQEIAVAIIDSVPASADGDSRATMAPALPPEPSTGTSAVLYVGVVVMLAALGVGAYLTLR